jgi:hypothetical protein
MMACNNESRWQKTTQQPINDWRIKEGIGGGGDGNSNGSGGGGGG